MNVYGNAHELKKKNIELCDTIFCVAQHSARRENNNRRITHKIRANDSLSKLARKYYNDESKWKKIYQANKDHMSNPNSLKIGQELLIHNITVSSNEDRIKIIKT